MQLYYLNLGTELQNWLAYITSLDRTVCAVHKYSERLLWSEIAWPGHGMHNRRSRAGSSEELVFELSAPQDDQNKSSSRNQGNPGSDGKSGGWNGNQHVEIAGMSHESVRAVRNDAMGALTLESDDRREEWICDHCPSLQGAAQCKYD